MIPIEEVLNPRNDYVFKRIFGYVGNEDITKDLISAIIDDIHIESLTLDCKEITEKEIKSDKLGILDIKAVIDNSIQCDIEMQMLDRKNSENRILFYWSKLYSSSLKEGMKYQDAKRTIVILFADYEIKGLEEIKKYISKWHIREDEYKHLILTNTFEIAIIEMPKYKKYGGKSKSLDTWIRFIINPGGIRMDELKENEALKKAKNVLDSISNDEKEQDLAFQRLIYQMDQKAIEDAGFDKGLEQGIKQGIEQTTENIAKLMLKENIGIELIIKCTGLTEEEIEKLK